jgi:hypothetical protein
VTLCEPCCCAQQIGCGSTAYSVGTVYGEKGHLYTPGICPVLLATPRRFTGDHARKADTGTWHIRNTCTHILLLDNISILFTTTYMISQSRVSCHNSTNLGDLRVQPGAVGQGRSWRIESDYTKRQQISVFRALQRLTNHGEGTLICWRR